MATTDKCRTTVYVKKTLWNELKIKAIREDKPVSEVLEKLIVSYVRGK